VVFIMRCFSEIEILVRKKNVEEKTSEHVFLPLRITMHEFIEKNNNNNKTTTTTESR